MNNNEPSEKHYIYTILQKEKYFFFNRYTSFNIEYSLELNKLTKTKLYSQLNNLKKTLNTRKAKQN